MGSYVSAEKLSEVLGWIAEEVDYGFNKVGALHEAFGTEAQELGLESEFVGLFSANYLHRARVLGVDTPGGLQALGKAAAGLVGVLLVMEKAHGPLPAPGRPSGDIELP